MKSYLYHLPLLEELFAGNIEYRNNQPLFGVPLLIIGFTNRSGSNLLGDFLQSTGRFNNAYESLNYDVVYDYKRTNPEDSFPDYIQHLVNSAASHSVFTIKASWEQILLLYKTKVIRMFTGITVVHIRRDDIVSQAVSFSIADQTKQWSSRDLVRLAEPQFDYEDIEKRVAGITDGNLLISHIIEVLGLESVIVTYEELTSSPRSALQKVGALTGIDLTGVKLEASLVRQSDLTNERFKTLYREAAFNEMGIDDLHL